METGDITIAQLRAERLKLQTELRATVQGKIDEFFGKTKIPVVDVRVEVLSFSGVLVKSHIRIQEVTVEIEL